MSKAKHILILHCDQLRKLAAHLIELKIFDRDTADRAEIRIFIRRILIRLQRKALFIRSTIRFIRSARRLAIRCGAVCTFTSMARGQIALRFRQAIRLFLRF